MSDFAPPANVQDEVLGFLRRDPTPEQIIAFHGSETTQQRRRYLLDASRAGILSEAECAELEKASQINHFVLRLKAKARHKAALISDCGAIGKGSEAWQQHRV